MGDHRRRGEGAQRLRAARLVRSGTVKEDIMNVERSLRMIAGGFVAASVLERRFPAAGGAELRNFQLAGGYFCRYPGTDDVGPDGIANVFDLF